MTKTEPQVLASNHLAIIGLLEELPPVGSVWPDDARRAWVEAVLAAFAVLYERAGDTA